MKNAIKPNHYQTGTIDVIESLYQTLPLEQFRGFMKGNVVKYIARYENKNGVEDLEKAEEYIRRLKEYENKSLLNQVAFVDFKKTNITVIFQETYAY